MSAATLVQLKGVRAAVRIPGPVNVPFWKNSTLLMGDESADADAIRLMFPPDVTTV